MQNDDNLPDNDFLAEMEGVKPIKQGDKVFHRHKTDDSLAQQMRREMSVRDRLRNENFLTTEAVEPVEPLDLLEYKKPGVQDGVYKNLRLGKYAIDSTLVIQSMGFKKACEATYQFIKGAHEKGQRAVLLKHGMGEQSKPYPAYLKSYVNQWLRQFSEVLAFHTAQKHHGGYGAVYVLLKKNEQKKHENRELHKGQ